MIHYTEETLKMSQANNTKRLKSESFAWSLLILMLLVI